MTPTLDKPPSDPLPRKEEKIDRDTQLKLATLAINMAAVIHQIDANPGSREKAAYWAKYIYEVLR